MTPPRRTPGSGPTRPDTPSPAESTPIRVALYANNTGEPRRVAVFHWSPSAGMTLEILAPEWGGVAKRYYSDGVQLPRERRMAKPSGGPVFMRGLLQPFRLSYYSLRDESEPGDPAT